MKQNFVLEDARFKQNIHFWLDQIVNALKLSNFTQKLINGKWWQQKQTNTQNNINRTFLILIGLFQKQAIEMNSENWLEVKKPKLNINTKI